MTAKQSHGASQLQNHPHQDIAIFRMDHLGDALMTSGFIAAMRAHLPESIITVFSAEISASYFARCPYVNHVISLPSIESGFREHPDFVSFLDQFRAKFVGVFDIAVNPRPAPDCFCAALFVAATEAPLRVAFEQRQSVGGLDPNRYYNHLVALPDAREHPALAANHLLDSLGVPNIGEGFPRLWIGRKAKDKAALLMPSGRSVALGIGAAHDYRIWPAQYFAQLADKLAEQNYRVLLIGSAKDQSIAHEICSLCLKPPTDLTGQTSLEEMSAIFTRCAAFIGNDSGPKNFAIAAGTPTIEIFYLADDMPGFEDDRLFTALTGRYRRIVPENIFSVEETMKAVAIRSIPPERVIHAFNELMQGL